MDISAKSRTLSFTEKCKTNHTILNFSSVLTPLSKNALFQVKAAFAKHGTNFLAWQGNPRFKQHGEFREYNGKDYK